MMGLRKHIRTLAGILIGEEQTRKLYGEDDAAERFQREAKRRGAVIVVCDLHAPVEGYLSGTIDPLTEPEEEHAEEEQKRGAVVETAVLGSGNCGGHPDDSRGHEAVPPFIRLKPGCEVTHMMRHSKAYGRGTQADRGDS